MREKWDKDKEGEEKHTNRGVYSGTGFSGSQLAIKPWSVTETDNRLSAQFQ